jgi:hypothetical protein
MIRKAKKSLALFFVVSSLFACSGNKSSDVPENAINPDVMNNPATAAPSGNSKDNVPAYEFEFQEHDFGTITQGEKVSFAFRFKNSGKGDLIIRSANGSCGCTVPEWPKDPVKPGEGGVINVTFNSEGKEGLQNKTVTLIGNTIPNTYVLTIKANVIKP